MTVRGALLVAMAAGPGVAQASDSFEGCAVVEAGVTTRVECDHAVLTVIEGPEADLPAVLGSYLSKQREQTGGVAASQQTALHSSSGLLPAARTEWTPKGSSVPTESWLTAAAPSATGTVLVECRATIISPERTEQCNERVRRVATSGLPDHLRGLVESQGGDWAAVEAKVGRPIPGVVGCESQIRSSSVFHLCEDGIVALALIPRSGGEVWQQQFLDGVLGGLPSDHVVGDEDSVPCQVADQETTCRRVQVTDKDGGTSWVISAVAKGTQSTFTAVCTYPDLEFALPLYCRSLFGTAPPAPAEEDSSRGRRSGRKQVR